MSLNLLGSVFFFVFFVSDLCTHVTQGPDRQTNALNDSPDPHTSVTHGLTAGGRGDARGVENGDGRAVGATGGRGKDRG